MLCTAANFFSGRIFRWFDRDSVSGEYFIRKKMTGQKKNRKDHTGIPFSSNTPVVSCNYFTEDQPGTFYPMLQQYSPYEGGPHTPPEEEASQGVHPLDPPKISDANNRLSRSENPIEQLNDPKGVGKLFLLNDLGNYSGTGHSSNNHNRIVTQRGIRSPINSA